jgi:hypothetical protein
MNMMSAIQIAQIDPVAALIQSLTSGLDAEGAAAIARYFFDSELADFCWSARQREAWIGEYHTLDNDVGALDRIVIFSEFDGRFHVGIALVDGDGCVHDLRQHRSFASFWDADDAFERLRQ